MSSELPDPWGEVLSEKGVHSYQDLAEKIGSSKSTAHRLVTGGRTSVKTVQAIADAFFAGDMNRVFRLRGSNLKGYGPWTPPDEVVLLSPKQREAVEAVIAAMVPDEQEGKVRTRRPVRPHKPSDRDRAITAGAAVGHSPKKATTPTTKADPDQVVKKAT